MKLSWTLTSHPGVDWCVLEISASLTCAQLLFSHPHLSSHCAVSTFFPWWVGWFLCPVFIYSAACPVHSFSWLVGSNSNIPGAHSLPWSDRLIWLVIYSKALIHKLYDWEALSKHDVKQIMCQHGLTIETAQDIGFNLSIPNTACWILNRGTASTIQWEPAIWTEVKERLEVIRDGNSQVAARLNMSAFPFIWLVSSGCIVWQPVFKTGNSNHMGFERSFTTIRPKLLMYQHFLNFVSLHPSLPCVCTGFASLAPIPSPSMNICHTLFPLMGLTSCTVFMFSIHTPPPALALDGWFEACLSYTIMVIFSSGQGTSVGVFVFQDEVHPLPPVPHFQRMCKDTTLRCATGTRDHAPFCQFDQRIQQLCIHPSTDQ